MALTIEVTKISVSMQMEKLWNITINLRCLDGTTEVINKNFSVRYRNGQNIQDRIEAVLSKLQKVIDDYKIEQQIFNHSHLNNVITYLQTNLVG
jgi:hypothetical protein